jgi:hypothetical protein
MIGLTESVENRERLNASAFLFRASEANRRFCIHICIWDVDIAAHQYENMHTSCPGYAFENSYEQQSSRKGGEVFDWPKEIIFAVEFL